MARAKYGVVLSLCVSVIATPFCTNVNNSREDIHRRSEDFYLRIMPLGASITNGDPAAPGTNGNGYRKPLRDQLRFDGWQVNMVGSQTHGDMADSDNEGFPGAVVAQINNDDAKPALLIYKPNVVLINAGTNDATANNQVDTTGNRMRDMIMECFIRVPGTVVILSTLIPNAKAPAQIDAVNVQYRNVAAQLKAQGFHIILAEMDDGFITIDDIWDGTHPYLLGFQKMASVWRHAINEAEKEGWLTKPSDDVTFVDQSQGTTCAKIRDSGGSDPRAGMQILTANTGLIYDDGPYVHSSTDMGIIFTHKVDYEKDRFYLAQLVNLDNVGRGGERDDLVIVSEFATKTTLYVNQGGGKFSPGVEIDVHDGCGTIGIRWGDVNNDGLDDFICLGPEGNMYVSINLGGNPPQFKSLGGTYFTHPAGYSQANVQLGDIDGDGRLDYCVVSGNGDIHCWRNGGLTDIPEYWQDLGKVAPGRNLDDINTVRFVDINGDGRSDLLYVDPYGRVNTYINQRGDGDGMAPKWLPAGTTHSGQLYNTGYVLFGQLYSERADYIWVPKAVATPANLNAWRNDGAGGTHQKGDGAHWGDMDANGNDDYVWISPDGKVTIFRNLNTGTDTSKFVGGGGWDAAIVNLETGFNRKALHVGDWDGDGKADIIGVDQGTGAVTVWKTNYAGPHLFSFTKEIIPNSGVCNQGWGIGLFDIGVIFADISGSGRVDYLCIHPNGDVFGWLNDKDSTMRSVGQVKFSEKYDRANHRFADVNGDGKADFLWVDKMNGDTKVWYNLGELTDGTHVSGSSFRWSLQGILYTGSSRGPNLHFPNIGGQGRADMVQVDPSTAHGFVWFNSCPRGGDDGPIVDPKLPAYNPSGPIDPTDPGDGGNAARFCNGNEGSWTPNLWNELGVGDWFDQRSRLYSSNGWPASGADDGVPRILAKFEFLNPDYAFNWPSECESVNSVCEIRRPDLQQNCTAHWERAFTLYAIGNYARLLENFIKVMKEETDGSAMGFASITTTMIATQMPTLDVGAGAWLSFVGGIIGGVAAVIPGGAAVGGVIGATLGSVGAMLGSPTIAVHDLRYSTFADLSRHFGDARDLVVDVAQEYFKNVLTTPPPKGDGALGTQLSDLIRSGDFANQDIASIDKIVDRKLLRKMIKAPIISEIWNSQRIFIVKFPKGKLDMNFDNRYFHYDPCYGTALYEDTFAGKYYCPYGEAGLGENNYLLLSWDSDIHFMYNDYGTTKENLTQFDFELSEFVISSDRLQWMARDFMPREPSILKDFFLDMAENPEHRVDLNQVLFANLPICDITDIELESGFQARAACNTGSTVGEPSSEDRYLICMQYLLTQACAQYKIDDHPWPYEVGLHDFSFS